MTLPAAPPVRSAVPPAAAGRAYRLVLAAACLLAVLTYVQRVGFAQLGPEVRHDFALDQQQWSYLTAAFMLAYGLFEIPCGLLGDRLGSRHLLASLTLAASATTAGLTLLAVVPVPLAAAFGVLLGMRFLFGAAQAGIFPGVARMLADRVPAGERATAQGVVWMASRFGGAASAPLMVALAVALGGWQLPLLLAAGLGLLWCALFWPWYRDPPGKPGTLAAGRAVMPWERAARSRSVWALCLLYGFCGFGANFAITLLPDYLKEQRHLPDDVRPWVAGLPLACGIFACLAGGVLSDALIRLTGDRKWGRRLHGSVGYAVSGSALAASVLVGDVFVLAALLCVWVFCSDLSMGPAWAAATDIGGRATGTLAGLMNMVGSFAGAAGNLVGGYLLQDGRPELLFAIYGCSYLLAALCWLGVDVTRPLTREDGR